MDKDKEIEELARFLEEYEGVIVTALDDADICTEATARNIINAGYLKVPDGAVVLTKEQYSDHLALKANYEHAKDMAERLKVDSERYYKNLGKFKDLVRKETAKEIIDGLLNECDGSPYDCVEPSYILHLAKKYGVEVNE